MMPREQQRSSLCHVQEQGEVQTELREVLLLISRQAVSFINYRQMHRGFLYFVLYICLYGLWSCTAEFKERTADQQVI